MAWLFWLQFVAFPSMGDVDSRSLRYDNNVRMQHFVRPTTYVPFRRFGGMCDGNSCNIFLLLFMVLGFYLRDALHEGCADAVACLHVPRAQFFPLFFVLLGGLLCFFL
jgi:hypothetical protein